MACIARLLPSPGGIPLLEKGLMLCGFHEGERIIDIGCGCGEAVEYIHRRHRLNVIGVDINAAFVAEARRYGRMCVKADATALPFASGRQDGTIFQCSFSKIEHADAALRENARVLKIGGKTLIVDFFAGEIERNFSGVLGRVESKEKINARLEANGLSLVHFQDCTHELREYWGQLIFDYGKKSLETMLGECAGIISLKCHYGLFIAEKKE